MINILISPSQQNGPEETQVRPICQKLYEKLKVDNLVNADIIPDLPGATDNTRLIAAINYSNKWFLDHGGKNSGYHLAIHEDAGYPGTGSSAFYYGDKGMTFVKPIFDALCAITPWSDMQLKLRTDLGELKQTDASAALIEISFYDKPDEWRWMNDNQDLIADTIADGIYTSLKLTKSVYIDWKKRYFDLTAKIASFVKEVDKG